MKIIAVVGTGSGCGKTTAASRILRAIPGLGAVKISPRAGACRVEWGAGGRGKDTAVFVSCGAAPVARIVGPREQVGPAWENIKARFAGCQGVVVEGAGALDLPGERYVVFVAGGPRAAGREARNQALAAVSDVLVSRASPAGGESVVADVRAFLVRSARE